MSGGAKSRRCPTRLTLPIAFAVSPASPPKTIRGLRGLRWFSAD